MKSVALLLAVAVFSLVGITAVEATQSSYVVVGKVRVDKALYERVLKLANTRAEAEVQGYLRMIHHSKVVPNWKERLQVRVRTFAEARQLVAHFFQEYARIISPHIKDIDEKFAQQVMRDEVEEMGRKEFNNFSRWFSKKYHHSVPESDVTAPLPPKDNFNPSPGHEDEAPTVQSRDRNPQSLEEDSKLDPNQPDASLPLLDSRGNKINEGGGPTPRDWARRPIPLKSIWSKENAAGTVIPWTEGMPQGDQSDSPLSAVPATPDGVRVKASDIFSRKRSAPTDP